MWLPKKPTPESPRGEEMKRGAPAVDFSSCQTYKVVVMTI